MQHVRIIDSQHIFRGEILQYRDKKKSWYELLHVHYSLFFIWPACTYGLEAPTKHENVWMNVESVYSCWWMKREKGRLYVRERKRKRGEKTETKGRRINVQQNEGEGVEGGRKNCERLNKERQTVWKGKIMIRVKKWEKILI